MALGGGATNSLFLLDNLIAWAKRYHQVIAAHLVVCFPHSHYVVLCMKICDFHIPINLCRVVIQGTY